MLNVRRELTWTQAAQCAMRAEEAGEWADAYDGWLQAAFASRADQALHEYAVDRAIEAFDRIRSA